MIYFNNLMNVLNARDYELEKTKDSINLTIDLPGFKKEEIIIKTKNNLLIINAKNIKKEFTKTFDLEHYIDIENIKSKLELGQIKIELPLKIKENIRKVEIE